METFRLLNDEKASKAMIDLEKKITGYSNMSRMNKPNPTYKDPEKGGSTDERVNPKKILLTDPVAVRRYMRYFMQDIYNKQEGLTPEEEHVISFLGRDGDNKVLEELNRRRLSADERETMEGAITKKELSTQLLENNHMKANSAPGLDGFTVAWVRHFWADLSDLCVSAVNNCYTNDELTRLLKTAIMRLLRKGEKCRLEATNYRPISLLSVFYKMASGVMTRRLETVMEQVIGKQQKAYSRTRNIGSVLINLLNMMQKSKQERIANLILCIDFKKAFDSIDHCFIDSTLKLLNFGPSFRKWVSLFFQERETYLLINGHMEEKITLKQGVPQGDILSPYIFNICVEILLLKITETKHLE